jgi:general secretion pathway protein D
MGAFALCVLLIGVPQFSKAQAVEPDPVTINFVNAEIEGVVKVVSEIVGKNFILDPRVKGTINVVSSRPMSRAMVYEVFLSALRVQGFVAIEERNAVKILPEADGKLQSGPVTGPQESTRGGGDRIQTRVFVLTHESAAQLVPILRPLIAPGNSIASYGNGNSLVITDYASNLVRIEKIISAVDQPNGTEPIVISLRYASAFDVAQAVNRLFSESGLGQAPTQDPMLRLVVTADPRSNSLLARSNSPAQLGRLRQFVAMIDSPTSAAGNMHVVALKNADATKLAETLRAIYGSESAPAGPRTQAPPQAVAGSLQPLQATPQSPAAVPGIIQADAATNSIIITAPDAIYNNLRTVIEKLDKRRAQVYVEALVAEVTAQKAAEFGIQWQDLSGASKTTVQGFGGTNFGNSGQNIVGITQNPLLAGQGLNLGVIKGVVSVPGVSGQFLNIGLLVRALESDSNANILSTPTLLTLENEEAKIVIGQNVPFITGQYAVSGAATTPTPFQTIERRDVGLTLRIRPQISEGGTVRLQIFQEVSSIQDNTNAAGVITNKRSVESTVLVDDGQIVVIGGLIQDTLNDGVGKVPGLGDLPLVGGLFQYKTRTRNKTNLMIFLRPTLLRTGQQADALASDRYDYILREQAGSRPAPSVVLPDAAVPTLPAR